MTLIRADLERKRDELRQQRGAAVLDQEAFNSDAIAAVEAEISALDDAEREETRRQRTAAEGAYQAELSENRSMLGALVAEDLRDVQEQETGIREFAAATARRIARGKQMATLAHALSGGPVPT